MTSARLYSHNSREKQFPRRLADFLAHKFFIALESSASLRSQTMWAARHSSFAIAVKAAIPRPDIQMEIPS